MEHKAFRFDIVAFDAEFREILVRALDTRAVANLRDFILKWRDYLTDPYEGLPLSQDWESELEFQDVDSYADICITKYYSPILDIGLGHDWLAVQEKVSRRFPNAGSMFGEALCGDRICFDPGKMGSYFMCPDEVRDWISLLSCENRGNFDSLMAMFEPASGCGLYTTF